MASNAQSTETDVRDSDLSCELKKLRHDSCQLFFLASTFHVTKLHEDCDPNHDSAARKTRSSVRSVLRLVHWWRSESKALLATGCVRWRASDDSFQVVRHGDKNRHHSIDTAFLSLPSMFRTNKLSS